jgi:hypothetical protein
MFLPNKKHYASVTNESMNDDGTQSLLFTRITKHILIKIEYFSIIKSGGIQSSQSFYIARASGVMRMTRAVGTDKAI